ncbi:MAG: D-aminoacyl-tRNA deacylase [Myxococcota bacterium]
MRAVVQRVNWARVIVSGETVGEIRNGLVVYLGAGKDDVESDSDYMVEKVAGLRVFEDGEGKMNLSVKEVGGGALVISQFTLYGDVRKGKRPSFTDAMEPVQAKELYEKFTHKLAAQGIEVAKGRFRAEMTIELSNDGPVTILIDSKKRF